ncbi:MAG: translocation/assembly module TamB domain-containing protein, partial [Phascolarctobacterium sp.]|nr:translocation/assembly module TamB domain-containing protein [Phascolarctobacterium sp.]
MKLQPINIKENRSSIIYGSVFTDVNTRIRGSLNDLRITGGISLLSGTNATYVMQSNSSLSSTDYSDMVSFISFADTAAVDKENEKRAKRQANFTATLGIDIDEGVQLGINLSSDGKNRIDLVGGGELLYTATALGDNRVSGRYNLTGGFVRYTPPFISQKIFNIEDGSNVSWNGDILNPMFNITAVQSQRSSVKSGDESRLVD